MELTMSRCTLVRRPLRCWSSDNLVDDSQEEDENLCLLLRADLVVATEGAATHATLDGAVHDSTMAKLRVLAEIFMVCIGSDV